MDQPINIPENLPLEPIEVGPPKEDRPQREVEPRKRPKWLWFLVVGGIFIAGLIVLRFAGGTFIREAIQEVTIEERTAEFSELGQPAPYFELENLGGGKIQIADFLGKPLVLVFWTTWNISSVDQLRILDDLESNKGATSVTEVAPLFEVVAINNQEDRSIVSSFVERGDYDTEVLLDETGAVGEAYKIKTLPVMYFLDEDGNIAYIYVGLLDAEEIVDKVGEVLSEE